MEGEIISENLIKLHVVCPSCNNSNYLEINKGNISESQRGLTTILIPEGIVCEHSFNIFVDKNGHIRGYESPDFILQLEPSEAEVDAQKSYRGEKITLGIIRSIFNNEIYYKTIRTILYDDYIVCITDNEYLQENLKPFLERIFGREFPKIVVTDLREYNNKWRNLVYSSKFRNCFVFMPDTLAIIKQGFSPKFKIEDFAFENSLNRLIKEENQTDEEMVSSLNNAFKTALKIAEVLKNNIMNHKIKSTKEITNMFQELNKRKLKVEITEDLIRKILRYRFNFEISEFLK